MRRDNYKIFSTGKIANLNLKNRIVRSATADIPITLTGNVPDEVVDYYRILTRGGAGMIITGDFPVSKDGALNDESACDVKVGGLEKIAEIVHETDSQCKVIAQLSTGYINKAPSERESPFRQEPIPALNEDEIKIIIRCFVQGVIRAKSLGYDGVQFHAAHGTLLCNFLTPYANRREDDYGGTVRKRVRIIREIVSAARGEVGNFPILIKTNCTDYIKGGIDIDSFPELALEIERAGIDAIEVSGGRHDCLIRSEEELGFRPVPAAESHTNLNAVEKQSYFYPYAEKLHCSIPIILVGGNKDVEHVEKLLRKGKVDFIAMCRPFICEPEIPNRWLAGKGKSTAECISCNSCIYDMYMNLIKKVLRMTRCLYKEDKDDYRKAQKWLASWVENRRVDNRHKRQAR